MSENRRPLLSDPKFLPTSSSVDNFKNTGFPAYDILQLQHYEGQLFSKDLKICMTGKHVADPKRSQLFFTFAT